MCAASPRMTVFRQNHLLTTLTAKLADGWVRFGRGKELRNRIPKRATPPDLDTISREFDVILF
jgi:hypothetical protein